MVKGEENKIKRYYNLYMYKFESSGLFTVKRDLQV